MHAQNRGSVQPIGWRYRIGEKPAYLPQRLNPIEMLGVPAVDVGWVIPSIPSQLVETAS